MKEKDDILDSPNVRAYLKRFKELVLPDIKESTVFAALIPGVDPDPKMCLEMGAALLMDKPIVAIVIRGRKIPRHLARIASEIVEVSDLMTEEDKIKVQTALDRVHGGIS